MNRCAAICLILVTVNAAWAAERGTAPVDRRGFVDRVYRDAAGEHQYVVFVPQKDPPPEGWPVILFLHGAGERGTDGRRQLSAGLGPIVKLRSETFPALVVFPQAENFDGPILRTWAPQSPDAQRALEILTDVEDAYPTNPEQRILTGWSMGALGTWALAAADPDRWSAVVPVAGGGRPDWAAKLTGVPIWAFHGAEDRITSPSSTRKIVEAVRGAGGQILYSEIPNEGHDVWRRVYDSDIVLNWMLAPDTTRSDLEAIELPEDRIGTIDVPFVPALIVQHALTMRLGQQAVDVIAAGLPAALEESGGLNGTLDDVADEVEFSGRKFTIRFGELSYAADLERTVIRAYGADRVQGLIGLRNVHLHVGRIAVTDGTVGFNAGDAEVVVGHREPVWLKVEVRPAVEKQQLTLKLLRSSFEIPDYNWFVREPNTIAITGDWLTEEEVKTAVVGGIYVRRETIEEQVLAAVPTMLDQFGERVDLTPLENLVEALWPLPVYHPEVRVAPESISSDAAGVSITFRVAIAAIDAEPPVTVPVVRASAPPAHKIDQSSDLRVGVAVDVVDHMSSLLAGTSAARLYTTDIPGQPFFELTDPTVMTEALPQLPSLSENTELQTSFALEAPLHLRPLKDDGPAAGEGNRLRMMIEAPRLAMHVRTVEHARPSQPVSAQSAGDAAAAASSAEVRSVFAGDLRLSQPLSLQVITDSGRPGLQMTWESDADVSVVADSGADAPGSEDRAAAEALAQLFSRGWKRWTNSQAEQVAVLPEVTLGSAAMTLRRLTWEGSRLTATFAPASTRIINRTKSALDYQVRGLHSRWSRERTLEAGESTAFETGAVIQLRPVRHWESDEISMPAGSVWELRPSEQRRKPEWVRTDEPAPRESP